MPLLSFIDQIDYPLFPTNKKVDEILAYDVPCKYKGSLMRNHNCRSEKVYMSLKKNKYLEM